MTFWRSQSLTDRLQELVPGASASDIDCNAIELRVGPEVFITPNPDEVNTRTARGLEQDERFILPPSQFAFLLTEERVKVPPNAMAFISMKATYKLMGLINVSGFHVDPGYDGPLTFSVYNAGPSPIHLKRGLKLFLIWYASLDGESEKRKREPVGSGISTSLLNKLSGATDSLPALEVRLTSRILALEKSQTLLKAVVTGLGTIAIAVGGALYPLFLAPFYKQVETTADKKEPPVIVVVPQPANGVQAPQVLPPSTSASRARRP